MKRISKLNIKTPIDIGFNINLPKHTCKYCHAEYEYAIQCGITVNNKGNVTYSHVLPDSIKYTSMICECDKGFQLEAIDLENTDGWEQENGGAVSIAKK